MVQLGLRSTRSVVRQLNYLAARWSSNFINAASGAGTGDPSHGKGLYLTNIDHESCNSPLLIGFTDYFLRHIPSIGFFQPIASEPTPGSRTGAPRHADLLYKAFPLQGSAVSSVGVTQQEAMAKLAAGRTDDLVEDIYTIYDKLSEQYDAMIVEGASHAMVGSHFVELNAQIAATLNAPVLMVAGVEPAETAAHIYDRAKIAAQVFEDHKADVLGLLVNKAPAKDRSLIASQIQRRMEGAKLAFMGALPYDQVLGSMRLDELQSELGAKLVLGSAANLDRDFNDIHVASAVLEQLLQYLESPMDIPDTGQKKPLVITSRSRYDILIALLVAHASGAGIPIAGILTTGTYNSGMRSRKIIDALQRQVPDAMLPVMHINDSTYEVTRKVSQMKDRMLPSSAEKISRAKLLFDRYINADMLVEKMDAAKKTSVLTPKMFMHGLTKRCQSSPQHIILPESMDRRVLKAAEDVTRRGIARITLLGDPERVMGQATMLDIDISRCQVIDHMTSPSFTRYVAAVCEARKGKNMTEELVRELAMLDQQELLAKDLLSDVNYWATTAVMCGDADGMVSGATHTTANTIRPALQLLRNNKKQLVSSVFFMCLPDKVLVYGDCAINVSPSAEELAQIAVTSADTAAAFGMAPPRVALLSYSTLGSGAGPDVEKVTQATQLARETRPDLFVEGPIQYDAAVDPTVAAVKIKSHSDVAGQATVCIFPDLNTGNNTYKAVQQSTGAVAIGPILQGLSKPVNDLSRGCTVADIINTIECTSIQAMQAKQRS